MNNEGTFWKKYVADMALELVVAAYAKVPATWREIDYVPEYNKFYYIVEGEGELTIGGRVYRPEPGQLFLMPQGVKQSYSAVEGKPAFGKYWCHFKAQIGNRPLFDVLETPPFIQTDSVAELAGLFQRLQYWQKRRELTSAIHVRAVLLELIARFLDRCGTVRIRKTGTGSLDKIERAIVYIEQHLSEHVSVEELAHMTHFHPNYFIRLFKRTTGYSPIQYVNRMRIEKAKHLLTVTNDSVSDIAGLLGLDVSYLSRMFKEYTGVSPSDYREMTR